MSKGFLNRQTSEYVIEQVKETVLHSPQNREVGYKSILILRMRSLAQVQLFMLASESLCIGCC
jgi:hypothetical protein